SEPGRGLRRAIETEEIGDSKPDERAEAPPLSAGRHARATVCRCVTLCPRSSTPNAGPEGTGPCLNAWRVLRATARGAAPPTGQAVISVNGRVTTQPPSRCPPECA